MEKTFNELMDKILLYFVRVLAPFFFSTVCDSLSNVYKYVMKWFHMELMRVIFHNAVPLCVTASVNQQKV